MKRNLLLAAALFAAACGQNKPPEKAAVEAPKPVEYFHVDASTAGALKGTIVFRGAKPPRTLISMAGDAGCEQAHAGHPVYDESVVVGRNGGLANAFVYIQSGLEGKQFELPKEQVALDQHGCVFVPRVIGMRAGQTLAVKNSDTVSHNIHPMPANNREWNEQQSPQSPDLEHKFPRVDIMIPVKCNVHSWMRAYVGVVDHPYFSVTAPDGSFELKNLPPGDYTVAAWHEKLGGQTQQIHVAASGTAAVNFTYR
jgi:plastocyanin